jgi:DNA-binding response OmpR family regulator
VWEALQEHGVEGELLVIPDGEKAIRFIEGTDSQESDCPDLVIVDLNLPKRSGSEVLERLKLSSRWGQVTVVILSSSDAADDRAKAARLGANQYFRKPLRLEEFLKLGAVFRDLLDAPQRPNEPL